MKILGIFRSFFILLVMLMLGVGLTLPVSVRAESEVSLLSISPESMVLTVGTSGAFKVLSDPSNYYFNTGIIKWNSSNLKVATVSDVPAQDMMTVTSKNGYVQAISTGTAIITAELISGEKVTARLTVVSPEIISIDMVDGKCGSKRNVCNAGVVNDGALEDTSSEYKWKCLGLEGGKNVNCSLKKPITKKCLNSKTTQNCTGSVCIKKTCASGKTCVDGGCITKPASGKKPTVGQACGSFGVCIKTSGTTKNGDKCLSTVNGGVGKIRINLCSGNNSIRCCEVK